MKNFDCKNCVHNGKGGIFNMNKMCEHCNVDTRDIKDKPTNYKEKEKQL